MLLHLTRHALFRLGHTHFLVNLFFFLLPSFCSFLLFETVPKENPNDGTEDAADIDVGNAAFSSEGAS